MKPRRLNLEHLESRLVLSGVEFVGPVDILRLPTTANGVLRVRAADIDQDGDLDVLAASKIDGRLSLFENLNGRGAFETARVLMEQATGLRSIETVDIDGDGLDDIVVSSANDSSLYWLRNQGQGSFEASRTIGILGADQANEIGTGDVDGDGAVDIFAIGEAQLRWYRNLPNGEFSGPIVIDEMTLGGRDLALTDADLDGDLDIVTVSASARRGLVWYENRHQGSEFVPAVINENTAFTKSLDVADFDGDGRQDIVTAGEDGKVAIYLNQTNQEAGFVATAPFVYRSAGDFRMVKAADIDGDGDLDVVLATRDSRRRLSVLYNLGDLEFDSQELHIGSASFGVDAGDIDGDGDLDVVAGEFYADEVAWYQNMGPSLFSPARILTGPQLDDLFPESMHTIDLDGDRLPDVLSSGFSTRGDVPAFYVPNSPFGFAGEQLLSGANAAHRVDIKNVERFWTADVNADEIDDLITYETGRISLHTRTEQGGGLATTAEITAFRTSNSRVFAIANLDDDPQPEFVSWRSSILRVHDDLASGLGELTHPLLRVPLEVDHLHSADLNGDGRDEVIGLVNGRLTWYDSQQGVFAESNDLGPAGFPIEATDVDADGDTDLVVAARSFIENGLKLLENVDGNGAFVERQITPTSGVDVRFVSVTDCDGDGDKDIMTPTVWLENDGENGFPVARSTGIDLRLSRIGAFRAADFDGDGDVDFTVTLPRDRRLIYYRNDFVIGELGDLNRDGDRDAQDIDLLFAAVRQGDSRRRFDLNGDNFVTKTDTDFLLDRVLDVPIGDANLDGVFDSSDLVQIFQRGEYEDSVTGNSGWESGDWNGDGEFTSSDLVFAFIAGSYQSGIQHRWLV